MSSNFFAMVNRMKLIDRWALMRNTSKENIAEHSHCVAIIAHALALIGNKKFGKSYNAERVCLLALYHDTTEVITGDMPTPVKYYNEDIKNVYKDIEHIAGERLVAMLPEEFRADYAPLFEKQEADMELWALVKAADKISALIKCIEEKRMGNLEFEKALEAQKKLIDEIPLEEVKYFRENFLEGYYLTLDEHTKQQ
ncbi:MAG: 5'-deoxynucleotidase [Eubacterium sp.]